MSCRHRFELVVIDAAALGSESVGWHADVVLATLAAAGRLVSPFHVVTLLHAGGGGGKTPWHAVSLTAVRSDV
jgi:hypothetical protein